MTKYIFITGGVLSSLGKGMVISSLGAQLQARGFKINIKKLEQYLNSSLKNMLPTQHGEIFVTDDGHEGDQDLGSYERFTGITTNKNTVITTGLVYSKILENEKSGKYYGQTIQVVPHQTNIIKEFITTNNNNVDFVLCEIGGTVGDIEGQYIYESLRQLKTELENDVCFIHLTYLPYIKFSDEVKTKPTQHSVKALQSLGIQPNIIMCRSDVEIPESELNKISMFCNVKKGNVIPALSVNNIYELPITYHTAGLDDKVAEYFNIKKEPNLEIWKNIVKNINNPKHTTKIAVVGKYIEMKDAYKSLIEAIKHSGIATSTKIEIEWIDSKKINKKEDLNFKNIKGIIVPGGYGKEGNLGKLLAIQYARENKIPFLGICLGMQLSIIEYCRNVLNIKNANSTEFDSNCENVIYSLSEMKGEKHPINFIKDTLISKIYNEKCEERHRNLYEVNTKYKNKIETNDFIFSGYSDDNLVESVELKNHPFFIGVQFHPELKSKPFAPAPLFVEFIKKCL